MAEYRALTVGVPTARGQAELPFGRELLDELATALQALGYTCAVHLGPPSAELGRTVRTGFAADGILIIHVIGHGEQSRSDALYMLGSDGERDGGSDVARWLSELEDLPGRPTTLLLLDLCHSGAMARLPWQLRQVDGQARTWVLAACAQDERAYDGRFTRALVTVLRSLAAGTLGVDPSVRYVPLQTIGRAVLREVNRLRGKGYRQSVTGSVIDLLAEPDLPFFPHPGYQGDGLRAALDPAARPFLDESVDPAAVPRLDTGLDERHFVDRASGGSLSGELSGFFTGRKEQVETLSEWIDGFGDGRLLVVTGGAGSGKSALLGVMVCAAHHALRAVTRPLWKRAAKAPYQVPAGLLAAVHARQRGPAEVVASLGRQLGCGLVEDVAALLDALPAGGRAPVIVIDALDEADDGPALLRDLLLPLVKSEKVRLVVGVRKYPEYQELWQAGPVVDLDEVDDRVLEDDLHHYVSDLLRGTERYRARGAVVGGFAASVAATLTHSRRTRTFGEFLVARVYTRHFADRRETVTDPGVAEELGRGVPQTLPEVFELDLAGHPPELLAVLRALAHAHGQGLPVTVLARLAELSGQEESIRQALGAGRFYLRTSVDTDGTTLYRLFHQGLTDHLKGTMAPGDVFDRLLPAGPDAERWRSAEPYVLRHAAQHALDAGRLEGLLRDEEYLIDAPPEALETLLGGWRDRLVADLRATTAEPEPVRRGVVALAAVRERLEPSDGPKSAPEEGQEGGRRDGQDGGAAWQPVWQPVWARPRWRRPLRRQESGQTRPVTLSPLPGAATLRLPPGPVTLSALPGAAAVTSVLVTKVEGRHVVLSADRDGVIRMWDLMRSRLLHTFTGHRGRVNALAVGTVRGRSIAVSGGEDGILRGWDLVTRKELSLPYQPSGPITAVALSVGHLAVASGTEVRLWPLSGEPAEHGAVPWAGGHALAIYARAGRPPRLAVVDSDGTLRTSARSLRAGARSILAHPLGGEPAVIVGDARGRTGWLTLPGLAESPGHARPAGTWLHCHLGGVRAMAMAWAQGRDLLMTGGDDGTIRGVDLTDWRVVADPVLAHPGGVTAMAAVAVDHDVVAVTGGVDGAVHVWKWGEHVLRTSALTSSEPGPRAPEPEILIPTSAGWRLVENGAMVSAETGQSLAAAREGWWTAEPVVIGGRTWAAIYADDGMTLWDPESGESVPAPVALMPRLEGLVAQGSLVYRQVLAQVVTNEVGDVQLMRQGSWERLTTAIRVHRGKVSALAVTWLGGRQLIVSADYDGWVRTTDVADWRIVDSLYVGEPVANVLASPEGHLVVVTAKETMGFRWTGNMPADGTRNASEDWAGNKPEGSG